jgi:hypothetical protein
MAVEVLDTYLYLVNAPFGEGALKAASVVELRREGQAFDSWIEQSPLMIDELRKQHEDLERLAATRILTTKLLSDLRQSSQGRGIQPQLRGLVRTR